MPIIIKHRLTDAVLHTVEAETLRDAYLRGADLRGAYLQGAYLQGADLRGAKGIEECRGLEDIRNDIWAVLTFAKHEAPFVLRQMREGRIDGSLYQKDGCACLVGSLGMARGGDEHCIPNLIPDGGRPAERWFTMFKPGDQPENCPAMKLTYGWIEQWCQLVGVIERKG